MKNTAHFIGKPFFKLVEVDSTNDYLQRLIIADNLPEGTAVAALFQSKGKGQRGSEWLSQAGDNILTSVLLQPSFLKPDEQFWLSKAVALGVHSFLSQYLPEQNIAIKWPNDILVDRKKMAGILIENTVQGNSLRNSVIGIGININQPVTLPAATSLFQLTGIKYDLNHLLQTLYMALGEKYMLLKNAGKSPIEAFYNKCLYGLGEGMHFLDNITQKEFAGTITGTTAYGALCIETHSGRREYFMKEVSFL